MKIFITLALIFLISCEDNKESENKYPLLENNFPVSLIKEVRFLDGFCKEDNNTNAFEFKDEESWISDYYDRKTGQIKTLGSTEISWKFEENYLDDRYDRKLPPNTCRLVVEHDLSSSSFVEGKAICTRWIRGTNISDNMEEVTLNRDEDAFCSIKVTKRQNCLPNYYLEKEKKGSTLIEKRKYETCSSEHRDEYRKQTLMRWEDHKNSLDKNE